MAISFLKALGFCLLFSFVAIAQDDGIKIGVGDTITINVYNERDLFVRAKVDRSGIVRFALIGNVTVVGKTVQELSEELEAKYFDGYLVSPNVSVQIESFGPFYVRGAVKTAGGYEYQFGMTVEKAIAVAGGLKDRASKKKWFIIRGIEKNRFQAVADTRMQPGDILEIEESLF